LKSLLIALVALILAAPVKAESVSFQEVEESLTCQCGCGLTVHSCNHLQCPSAIPLRQEIRQQMNLDKNKSGILAHFAEKYGEKVLSSPTTSGFNITAWVTPFIAVGLGGWTVLLTLRRWTRRSAIAAAAAGPVAEEDPQRTKSEAEKTLERELEGYDP
jgi:cytochrome c-type biogenesis protein CcmH